MLGQNKLDYFKIKATLRTVQRKRVRVSYWLLHVNGIQVAED